MIGVLAFILTTHAAEPSAEALEPTRKCQPDISWEWGAAQGLMAGVFVMHGVQPLAVATGEAAWKDKYYVSIAGTALYGTTLGGLLAHKRWALYTAIIGPAVGVTSVVAGWGLSQAGVIDSDIRPDTFQIAGGVLQVGALALSVDLLKRDPRWQVTLGPMSGTAPGLAVGGAW